MVSDDGFTFEHFPNLEHERKMELLEQIAASLKRIEGYIASDH